MYTLYIIKCNDNSLYTGIAKNLNKRLDAHKQGIGSKYVRARLPFLLVYTEKCKNRSIATKKEISIKKLNKQQKMKLFASSHTEMLD